MLLRELTNKNPEAGLRVYVTGDGSDVYEDDFMAVARPEGSQFWSTMILIGTRLGIDRITPTYYAALLESLQMSQSIGIAG
jgi:cysteine protease ATG4